MFPQRTSVFLATSSALLALPAGARAQNPAAAQALFESAKELAAQERYGEACMKFEESDRLDPGIGTKFHLADCWQHEGRTASAWSLFRDVEAQAHTVGQPTRERVAHNRAAALEPLLSKLAIDPGEAASLPHVDVRRDGLAVDRAQWNVPVPVDPGSHVVSVTASGKEPWQTTVEVTPEGRVVTVDVPPLADLGPVATAPPSEAAAPPPAPSSPPESAPPVVPPHRTVAVQPSPPVLPPPPAPRPGVTQWMPLVPTETAHVDDRGAAQRALGWFFVGAGVVGLGAAGYFAWQWSHASNQASFHCIGSICDAAGAQYQTDAHNAQTATWVSVGTGAGSMFLGTVLIATAPVPRLVLHTASVEIQPVVNPRGPSGLAVLGSF
ncbi:MAG TPA: hypothetical protein VEK07_12505 [Polyangiaceae bacterium]|nr:hypothetical protein [Polyangiaceae bacterium]